MSAISVTICCLCGSSVGGLQEVRAHAVAQRLAPCRRTAARPWRRRTCRRRAGLAVAPTAARAAGASRASRVNCRNMAVRRRRPRFRATCRPRWPAPAWCAATRRLSCAVSPRTSRLVAPGDLFVAVQGFERDGLEFVARTRSRARWPSPPSRCRSRTSLACWSPMRATRSPTCPPPSSAIPRATCRWSASPARTARPRPPTCSARILEAHGLRTGWLTTVNTRIGDEVRPNAVDHTTPEAPIVQRTLAEMRAAGLDVAILETSSHALEPRSRARACATASASSPT